MSRTFEEPTIPAVPARVQRPLLALWISLALHAAVIGLVRVAPPGGTGAGGPVIEARLMPAPTTPAAPPAAPPTPEPAPAPLLTPGPGAESLPVATPLPAAAPPAPAPAPREATPVDTPAVPAPHPATDTPTSPPAGVLTSSVDLTYYSARELDVQPRALHRVEPDYPAEADRTRVSGTVRLLLKIEADGRVSDVEVVSANPPDVFDESARKAFAAARFSPAQKSGRPVRARMLIEVEYDWDGRR